jgi:hypothetical protein
MLFKEAVASDLELSSRIIRTGTLSILLDVLSYGFSTVDEELREPVLLEVAAELCRKDCSVYRTTEYV